MSIRLRPALAGLLWLLCACASAAVPSLPYEVVARYPHRSGAFTQGFELVGTTVYESSGLYRKSFIAHWPLEGSAAITRQALPPTVFGEGLTVLGDRIYVLSWREQRGFVFERESLRQLTEFTYSGEGWGLANDGQRLLMSDGTPTLRFLDPRTLKAVGSVEVRELGVPLHGLNELEWVDGRVLANIWQTDTIVVLDPTSGAVTAHIDLSHLYPRGLRHPNADVLNGIALDRRDGTVLVTGKYWPSVYRLRLLAPLP